MEVCHGCVALALFVNDHNIMRILYTGYVCEYDDLYLTSKTRVGEMAAEVAEEKISRILRNELEKVDKECVRPLQVRVQINC